MACPYCSFDSISSIKAAVLGPSRLFGNHIAAGQEKGTEMADRQFAIYSVDDESLNFYRYGRIPVVGTEFAGKHVRRSSKILTIIAGQLTQSLVALPVFPLQMAG